MHEQVSALPVSVLRLLGAHEPLQPDAGSVAAPLMFGRGGGYVYSATAAFAVARSDGCRAGMAEDRVRLAGRSKKKRRWRAALESSE